MATDEDTVVVVGDAAKIEKALSSKLGKFEVVKPQVMTITDRRRYMHAVSSG